MHFEASKRFAAAAASYGTALAEIEDTPSLATAVRGSAERPWTSADLYRQQMFNAARRMMLREAQRDASNRALEDMAWGCTMLAEAFR